MAITTNAGEQAVQATFHDQSLVGMLAPQGTGQKVGYSVLPNAIEAQIQTPTTGLLSPYRCDRLAKQVAPLGWFEAKADNTQSLVCVLHPDSAFDEANPQPPHTFFYDKAHACYAPTPDDVDGSDRALWVLHETFIKAEADFRAALAANQHAFDRPDATCPKLDRAFAHYEVARRNLETAIQCREYSLAHDEKTFSEFFAGIQATVATQTSEALFAALAPKSVSHAGDAPETKAAHCIAHYEAMLVFFKRHGRYCPAAIKEKLLGNAVFALQDALKEAPRAKAQFTSNVSSYLSFQRAVHQFSHPMTNNEFRTALVKFLFNKSEDTPSEALRRAAALNPDQRRKLEQMAEVKREAIAAAKRNPLRRGVRATILTFYDLQAAIGSMISDRRFIGVEEIIRKALKKSDGWIPSRPFQEFLSDDDAELEALARLDGLTPQEVEARKAAMQQIAFRVRQHAQQAFERNCHGQITLEAALLHTADIGADFDDTSGYFHQAHESLERDVYGRLQRLGTMDHAHPGTSKRRIAFAPQPARAIYQEYSDIQGIVDDRLGPAVQNLYQQLDGVIGAAPIPPGANDRISSLPDDIRWLRQSFPVLEVAAPSRPVVAHDYPEMPKTLRVRTQVDALAARVEAAIRTSRAAIAIDTAAHRAATFAPTSDEIRTYLNGFDAVVLTGPTLGGANADILEGAQAVLQSAQDAAIVALGELDTLVQITPSQRGPLMRELYEAFFELNDALTHDITDQAALDNANRVLLRAAAAYTALANAHL